MGGRGKSSKVTEIEKSKLYADVTECLRTYDMLGLWRDAEDVLRREVVREFVKKVLFTPIWFRPYDNADQLCRRYTLGPSPPPARPSSRTPQYPLEQALRPPPLP